MKDKCTVKKGGGKFEIDNNEIRKREEEEMEAHTNVILLAHLCLKPDAFLFALFLLPTDLIYFMDEPFVGTIGIFSNRGSK